MKKYNWNSLSKNDFSQNTAVTIGVFDGIHIGHKELLNRVLEAKKKGLSAGVVTFSDSIFSMFKNGENPLQSLEERYASFEKMGFDFVILIDFTPEIAKTPGLDFLQTLKEKCRLSVLVEGEDFRFGDGGKTGMEEIRSFCLENNIESEFVPPVIFEGKRVSSTMIRALFKAGNEKKARNLMF